MNEQEERDLIVLLAERVMGWEYWSGDGDSPEQYDTLFTDWSLSIPMAGVDVYENGSHDVTRRWTPLEKIADAWMLVDALMKRDLYLSIECDPSTACHFLCHVWTLDPNSARVDRCLADGAGRTAPEAICDAAKACAEESAR